MVEKRPIGDSGIEVTPLVLGGNVFDWTADEPTSFAVLDAFVDAGGMMIDTADVYSGGGLPRRAPRHPGDHRHAERLALEREAELERVRNSPLLRGLDWIARLRR